MPLCHITNPFTQEFLVKPVQSVYLKNPSGPFAFFCFWSSSVLHLEFIALEGMNSTISFLSLGISAIFPDALQLSPSRKDYLKSALFWLHKLTSQAPVLKGRFQFILVFTKQCEISLQSITIKVAMPRLK